jgi:phage-related minor tail protein
MKPMAGQMSIGLGERWGVALLYLRRGVDKEIHVPSSAAGAVAVAVVSVAIGR